MLAFGQPAFWGSMRLSTIAIFVVLLPFSCLPVFAQVQRAPGLQLQARLRMQTANVERLPSANAIALRAQTLLELMQRDPERALSSALSGLDAQRLLASGGASPDLVESWEAFEGDVEILVLDDLITGDSSRRTYLRTPSGTYEAHLLGVTQELTSGTRVQASGIRLGTVIAARVSAASPQLTSCSVTGDQKVVVLLLNFQGSNLPAETTQTAMRDAFFATTRSLNSHWRESSYGRTSASGDVFGPFTLPASNYTDQQFEKMLQDAIQVADATVDFTRYSRIFLIYPTIFPFNGAVGTIGCEPMASADGSFVASASWIRADFMRDRNYCTPVHEGGHNLGLEHASTVAFGSQPLGPIGEIGTHDEYGDIFSSMGHCRYINGTWITGHYAAPHKAQLGWLTGANLFTTSQAGDFVISPLSSTTAALQGLKVRRGAGNDRWLWIEARQPIGDDQALNVVSSPIFDGVLAHYEDPSATDYIRKSRLIDFWAAQSPGQYYDATLRTFETWRDPYSPLTLAVTPGSGGNVNVSVRYDTPCAVINPQSTTAGQNASTGTVSVTAPADCAWIAASNNPWITVQSGANGSGNGTVSYSVAANSTGSSRNGTISIGRQNFTVTQSSANSSPVATSVSPSSGSSQPDNFRTFQFVYTDADGATALSVVSGLFTNSGSANACFFDWDRASNEIRLYGDSGTTLLGRTPGSSFNLNNSQCQIAVANSSVSSSGNTVTLTVSIAFKAAFAGARTIHGRAQDSAGADSGWSNLGLWNVTSCSPSFNPGSASFGAVGGSSSVSVTLASGCSWTATSNNSWISVTSGASGNGNGTVSFTVAANTATASRSGSLTIAGSTFAITQAGAVSTGGQGLQFVPVTPCRLLDTRNGLPAGGLAAIKPSSTSCGIPANAQAYSLNVTVVPGGPLPFLTIYPAGQPLPNVSTLNSLDGRIKANAAIVPAGTDGAVSVHINGPTAVILDINGYFVPPGDPSGLVFYPLAPCRVADTRQAQGAFGGPALAALQTRRFAIRSSACGVPPTARAYSFNTTVVPSGPLAFITMFPAGQALPNVSTLNALNGGVTANAAIVPASSDGSIDIYSTGVTHLVLDINGYFAPPGGAGGLLFYGLTPCRILDTRNPAGTFGGPIFSGFETRDYPIPSASCGVPSTATAYSLSATVVPQSVLGYLTLWPGGQSAPSVSTLNSTDGAITSNAALVPAGPGGIIRALLTNPTHFILDINGYFAP